MAVEQTSAAVRYVFAGTDLDLRPLRTLIEEGQEQSRSVRVSKPYWNNMNSSTGRVAIRYFEQNHMHREAMTNATIW